MTGPLGNSEFCFLKILMFSETESRETLRFSGNKIHCSHHDQSLSVKCFSLVITLRTEIEIKFITSYYMMCRYLGHHHHQPPQSEQVHGQRQL